MDANIEMAGYAVGGFILPGVVASSMVGAQPPTMIELRQRLGMVGIASVVAGVLVVMASGSGESKNGKAAGVGVAISGALLALAALKVPQTTAKAQIASGVMDPLMAAMQAAASNIPR